MRARIRTGAMLGAGAAALALWAPAAGAQERARALDRAADAFGGRAALNDLGAFRLNASGNTFIVDEGPQPGDDVSPASTFRVRLDYDVRRGDDRMRADSVRTSLGTNRRVSEVIAGRRGYISGNDANFQPAGRKPMTSDRWAAILREQRLLNPHLYVIEALRRPRLASPMTMSPLRLRPHHRVRISGDVAPVELWIDARTGRLTRLTTIDHNYNRGDVPLSVEFRRWQRAGGVWFPRRVTLAQDSRVLHVETRSRIRANPRIAGARFRIPGGLRAPFDRRLADRGARTTEWLMTFAHLGFVKDGEADEIVARTVAPGSTLIQGNGNQSMIVEQQDGIVVVEAALHDYRAEALISYVRRRFPGKPIRYATVSHHHADHAGGLRPFAALGARPVVHADAVPFFERSFASRDSRLLRDRLDRSNAIIEPLAVPDSGSITLPDPVRPVVVLPEPTSHASTTVLVYVPTEGVLFVNGDTYTPGAPPGPGARSLDRVIRANGLAVNWIAGGHGSVISYADFQAALAG